MELSAAEHAADEALKTYEKTAEEIRAEITPAIRDEEAARAARAICEATRKCDETLAAGYAEARAAIRGAESTRVDELTLLANRLAHDLASHDPGHASLWDYLVLTDQLKGKSRRKDCTDDDLKKIRNAHQGSARAEA